MKLEYRAKKFARCIYGKKLFGNKTLEFSESELIHSAIMVGKDSIIDYGMLGITGEFEICYRVFLLCSLLERNISDRLVKSINYRITFDPTEKAFASYFLGNVFTKLVSTKLLGITKLLHYDLYKDTLNIRKLGNRRPDFIGKNANNEWILAESKGRSGTHDKEAMVSGKNQLSGVYSINNVKPSLKYVVQTFFERNVIKVYIEDPEGNSGVTSRLILDEPMFKKSYYRLIVNLLNENSNNLNLINFKDQKFYYHKLTKLDVGIGLRKDIYDKYIINDLPSKVAMILDGASFMYSNDYYYANDGVLIICNNRILRSNFK